VLTETGLRFPLSADSSNFLQAVKLDGAVAVPGLDPDTVRPLSEVAEFAAVASGSIVINGVSVAVDPQADGLDDVMARINAADAGAVATFDVGTQQMTIAAASGRANLVVATMAPGCWRRSISRARGFSRRQRRRSDVRRMTGGSRSDR
jgi:hypothetical protein